MRFLVGTVLCSAALPLALASTASAQLITLRTVPVAQSEQFDVYPSHNSGMAGVSLALHDSLLDPFGNPAKGARLRTSRLFSAPAIYDVSKQTGGGRTFPAGVMLSGGAWFGSALLALQEIDAGERFDGFFPGPLLEQDGGQLFAPPEQHNGNALAAFSLGRRLGGGVALAGSLQWSRLHAIDGVDLMYAGSQSVQQRGGNIDGRFGLLKDGASGASYEAVIVHNRFRMRHDVNYVEFVWDPATQSPVPVFRLEENNDHTNTWGLQLAHSRPVGASPWRLGWTATVNRMSHPKIPNYEIQNLPRDPGYTTALNLGMGFSRQSGGETFGADFVFEPARSHTWAEAEAPVTTSGGAVIPAGGRTVSNRFRFRNALFRLGFNADLDPASTDRGANLQLGLIIRAVRYRLDQDNHVQGTSRSQAESWTEWTPTWGLGFGFSTFEIRYRGQVTHGTGRPGLAPGGVCFDICPAAPPRDGAGILAAPSGPMTLDNVRVVMHHISLSLPLR